MATLREMANKESKMTLQERDNGGRADSEERQLVEPGETVGTIEEPAKAVHSPFSAPRGWGLIHQGLRQRGGWGRNHLPKFRLI